MRIFLFGMLFFVLELQGNMTEQATKTWTRLFRKVITRGTRVECLSQRSSLVFLREDVPQFSQLILSWNAFRPAQGYFSLDAQVRDAATGKWHKLHRVADWGANVQRSFFDKNLGTAFHHVRLEVPHRSDG